MRFEETPLAGAFVIEPEPVSDNRGFFARLFCTKAFSERGLNPHLDQISMSYNARAGTLRGLHLQRPPHAEAKLVRVTAGAIFDVIVDVRAGSPTLRALVRDGAQRGEPPAALYPGRLRARLPDARGR